MELKQIHQTHSLQELQPSETHHNGIFNDDVQAALEAWNTLLIKVNRKNPPQSFQEIHNNRMIALSKYTRSFNSNHKLAEAFRILHPEWANGGSPTETIRGILTRMDRENINPLLTAEYHQSSFVSMQPKSKRKKCQYHSNRLAIVKDMCTECALIQLKSIFKRKAIA
jgi:hypothetical protein